MLASQHASQVCRRPVHPGCPIPSPVRKAMRVRHRPQAVAKPLVGPGVSKLAAEMEPFAGCNCYYLLDKSIKGMSADSNDKDKKRKGQEEREYVWETLRAIKGAGFNVIRIWAFNDWYTANDDAEKLGREDGRLQMKPGVANSEALKGFDWLLDEVEKMGGIKLMMTLTNGVNDYGGMQQYVRWANDLVGPGAIDPDTKFYDPERYEFYTNRKAKQCYMDYVTQIVTRYRYHSCIHSWDICNEPRNRTETRPPRSVAPNNGDIASWVHEAAGHVKSLDNKHPVTVGSEGFFGPSGAPTVDNEWQYKYPFGNNGEGCDWLLEGKSSNIDFVCVHPYGDQWRDKESTEQKLECNKKWIDSHIEACKTHLGGKPLVLQEFNMPRRPSGDQSDTLRLQYYDYVKDTLLSDNALIGTMMWMVAHEGYLDGGRDLYTLYPSAPELNALCAMNREVNKQPPAPSASTT